MASRNVPVGDSVELYFVMPSTRIATATTFSVEAKYLDTNKAVPANHLFFANDEEAFTSFTNSRISVRRGAHHFYICARLNADDTTINGDRIEVKITPLNNREWFKDDSYTASAVIENRQLDSSLSIPLTISTEEGKEEIINASISPALEKPANLNVKITHVTTNSTALDGLRISTNNGVTWTNILNNVNFLLPVGSVGFLIKYFIKTNNNEEGNRYFDITTTETTSVKVIKPIVNVKTRVTVIDTTKLKYGDIISTYCSGIDLIGIYSDGSGGRYEEPIILNAAACGSVILPPDTVIRTFCAGTTRIQHLSNGAGGYYRKVLAYNSTACNYVELPLATDLTVTPTTLNPNKIGSSVILNEDADVFGALLRDNGISKFNTRFGKWYFEVQVYVPTDNHFEVGLGFGTTDANLSEWIGANNKTWSWWPFDSTKYHGDVQGIYAQLIDVKDKDIIGVLLDMENQRFGFSINGAFQGWTYEGIADEKMHFLIAGRFDSWAFINFGKFAFKYEVPEGFHHGFGAITNPPIERGTIISYFCAGVDRWVKRADGRGSTYDDLFKRDAVECGWVDPKPPIGTIIGFVCDGFDKYNKIADGNGGFTIRLSQINSTECGYTPPSEGSLSNVLINNSTSAMDTNVVLTGDKLSYFNLHRTVIADWGNYSGIWYWELIDWTGAQYVGFQNRDNVSLTYNLWDQNGIAYEPLTGFVNNRGIKEKLLNPIAEGTPIGIGIDFKEQTITVFAGSQEVTISTKINYPLISANRFVPSVTALVNGVGEGTFNFGQVPFNYTVNGKYKPYQKPSSPFQQRGTVLSYKCEAWVRWVSRADGNGSSFIEIYEQNSATCGWYPDPAIGTILGYYCEGYARYKTVANGNYTTVKVLVEIKSTDCGYIPAGVIISLYCVEKDQWATKSDGNDGTYEELIKANSSNCGYIDSEDDLSDQEPDDRFNINHTKSLPVSGYDIIHNKILLP